MSISIVSCPKCGTFLLSDTAQCHRCRFVIHPERASQFRDSSLPSDAAIQQDMERCRQCGETCRKGLVRCWSCGAFTRPEIEAAYYRLLQGHAHTTQSASQKYELPEISREDARRQFWTEEDKASDAINASQNALNASQTAEYTAFDEDFELSGNLRLLEDSPLIGDLPEIPPLASAAAADEAPIQLAKAAEIPVAVELTKPGAAAPTPNPAPTGSRMETPPADDAEALLSIAKQQETDVQKSRKAKLGEGFVIFCPMGCKIRVQERHRGKIGRCPKCQATFVVPMARQTSVSGSIPANAGETAAGGPAIGTMPAAGPKFSTWLQDVHLHKVAPEKLRIKADSLLKDFQEVDLAFDPTGLLIVSFSAGGGMFGGSNAKKKDAARAAAVEHLGTKGTTEGLPAAFKQEFPREAVGQISLTQPTLPGVESLFGDILVFGAGRVAVRLPKFDDKTTSYLSFSLSQFREFSRLLGEFFGIENYGGGCGIPLRDDYKPTPCFFTKKPVKELQNLTYYEKDPSIKLEISGYRCKLCQTVISEVARAGQKLGGANAKGIAKAKCPKCTKPMGNQPLYVAPAPAESSAAEDSAAPAEESQQTPETTAV